MRRRKVRRQRKLIVLSMIGLLFVMTIGYAAFQTNLNITVKGNIKEKSRVMRSWASNDNEDFHTQFYRDNLLSVTFLDTNSVPSNAVESWDVSADRNRGVMAYVLESTTTSGKYDLFIGANKGVIANEDSSRLFQNFYLLDSINFNGNFDTSNVVNMSFMFSSCNGLTSLDVSGFNTENVTDMSDMFAFCQNLSTLDLSSFNTKNVTNMRNMFNMFVSTGSVVNNKLASITFGNLWDTSKVVSMGQMFTGCNKLTSIDVSNWNTSSVVSMASVFAYCSSLTSLDLSRWDTTNVTTFGWLFMGTSSLTELNLCSFNTKKATTMQQMFSGTTNINKIKVGPNWSTANANVVSMFSNSKISSVTAGQC